MPMPADSTPRVPNSSAFSASDLESPHSQSRTTLELPPGTQHNTNNPRQSDTDLTDANTPPSSGATTPTASTHDRKTRSLLGLYPLAGFLRSHYPSVVGRPTVKSVAETSEGGLENGNASAAVSHNISDEIGDDDEDRRTIRGDTTEGEPEQELKRLANGHSINVEPRQGRKEKSLDEAIPLDFAAPALASNLG
jgi:UV radiation resistance-associated gene protein